MSKNGNGNGRGGRPRKELDIADFERLCFLQCTLLEMCEWFNMSDKTLEKRVREHYGCSFSEVFQRKRVGGKISLRRNLFRQSETNPATAIFLAKNWLGMSDRLEVGNMDGKPFQQGVSITVQDEATRKNIDDILEGRGLGK